MQQLEDGKQICEITSSKQDMDSTAITSQCAFCRGQDLLTVNYGGEMDSRGPTHATDLLTTNWFENVVSSRVTADPKGWDKAAAVRLYFIFPEICILSLDTDDEFCVSLELKQGGACCA
ncbi:hypothetical protein STEG23_037972, partial [Scotinomys teguina]